MAVPARVAAIVALVGLVPALAFAQGAGPQAPQPPPADTSAPASTGSAKPVVPATGYGWSTTPAKRGHGRARLQPMTAKAAQGSPNGTVIPGFETLADGSSRVFVQLPKQVAFAGKSAKGSLTYVLKGVRIDRRNNLNSLVTVHFNTPVSSARLVPHGGDLWLVIEMRANIQPTVAMDATKDGGAMLRVEFPKGDYLSDRTVIPLVPAPASSATTPAPAGSGSAPSGL
jgi:hypothetical protein